MPDNEVVLPSTWEMITLGLAVLALFMAIITASELSEAAKKCTIIRVKEKG